jgi:hypothetical protein
MSHSKAKALEQVVGQRKMDISAQAEGINLPFLHLSVLFKVDVDHGHPH